MKLVAIEFHCMFFIQWTPLNVPAIPEYNWRLMLYTLVAYIVFWLEQDLNPRPSYLFGLHLINSFKTDVSFFLDTVPSTEWLCNGETQKTFQLNDPNPRNRKVDPKSTKKTPWNPHNFFLPKNMSRRRKLSSNETIQKVWETDEYVLFQHFQRVPNSFNFL